MHIIVGADTDTRLCAHVRGQLWLIQKAAHGGGKCCHIAHRHHEAAIAIEDSLAYMEPPYWYYPVRQSLGSVYLRQGRLDESEKVLRESLLRSRGNGWALAGLAEVYRRKGDRQAERATRQAYESAWFGDKAPDIARL